MITRIVSPRIQRELLAPARRLVEEVESQAAWARSQDNGPCDADSRIWRVDARSAERHVTAEIRCQGEDPIEGVMALTCQEGARSWEYHREGYDEHFSGPGAPHVIRNQRTGVLTILED